MTPTPSEARVAEIAAQLLRQAEWCERHHPGCDCSRIYRRNAAHLTRTSDHAE